MVPKDPVMLLSYINTRLRDIYPSLSALCEDMALSEQSVIEALQKINYVYDEKNNQFR